MSFLANEWASEAAPVVDVHERVILSKLANHANDDGCDAYPGKPKMARAAISHPETVRTKLRSLEKRGLIARGDQRLVNHYPADKRPVVYDVQIPASWYSEQQLARVNRDRAEAGKEPLNSTNRPDLAPAPQKSERSDKGKPNPKRSPKKTTDTGSGADSQTPVEPRGQSHWGREDNHGANHIGAAGPITLGSRGQSHWPKSVPPNPSLEPVRPERAPAREDAPSASPDETERTDEQATKNGAERHAQSVASELVHAPELQADLTRIDLLPARKKHQQSQYTQLVKAIDAALLRFPPEKVEWYLRDKAHAAKTVKWLVTAFTSYADAIADVPMPDQDQDAATADAKLEQSLLDAAPPTPTSAPVAAGDAKATTRAPSGPVEPYQDATSPVEDLPDEVYAALSPAEKATVHAHAGTAWESLPSMAARQLRAIYDRVSAAA